MAVIDLKISDRKPYAGGRTFDSLRYPRDRRLGASGESSGAEAVWMPGGRSPRDRNRKSAVAETRH